MWFCKHVIKLRSDWPKVFEMHRGEPRNGPKDTRPPFRAHFVSGSGVLGTRLFHIGEHGEFTVISSVVKVP